MSVHRNCHRDDNLVDNALDNVSAQRLWELSCELVGIEDKQKL